MCSFRSPSHIYILTYLPIYLPTYNTLSNTDYASFAIRVVSRANASFFCNIFYRASFASISKFLNTALSQSSVACSVAAILQSRNNLKCLASIKALNRIKHWRWQNSRWKKKKRRGIKSTACLCEQLHNLCTIYASSFCIKNKIFLCIL